MKQEKKKWHGKDYKISRAIAFKLPMRIVYWCIIRAWSIATTGKYSDTNVTTVTVDQMLKRLEKK